VAAPIVKHKVLKVHSEQKLIKFWTFLYHKYITVIIGFFCIANPFIFFSCKQDHSSFILDGYTIDVEFQPIPILSLKWDFNVILKTIVIVLEIQKFERIDELLIPRFYSLCIQLFYYLSAIHITNDFFVFRWGIIDRLLFDNTRF